MAFLGQRVTRLELATSSLARRCSTTELHPHFEREGIIASHPPDARFLSDRKEAKNASFFESKPAPGRISFPKQTMKTAILTCLCSIALVLPAFGQSPTPSASSTTVTSASAGANISPAVT